MSGDLVTEGFSAHLSMLFTEHVVTDRPAAARDAGFRAVESWWPPDEVIASWAAEIQRLGLELACLNAYAGNLDQGERGFLNVPAMRERVLEDIGRAIALAHELGARNVNVLIGRDRGDLPRRVQWLSVVETLREASTMAAEAGVGLVVEHLNEKDIPGYLAPTAASAVKLIEAVGSPSVRLLYDAYHAAMAGSDPTREAADLVELIGHVQFADVPGRGAPGTGTLDLWALEESLRAAGYAGPIGLEYAPRGLTLASLSFLGRSAARRAESP